MSCERTDANFSVATFGKDYRYSENVNTKRQNILPCLSPSHPVQAKFLSDSVMFEAEISNFGDGKIDESIHFGTMSQAKKVSFTDAEKPSKNITNDIDHAIMTAVKIKIDGLKDEHINLKLNESAFKWDNLTPRDMQDEDREKDEDMVDLHQSIAKLDIYRKESLLEKDMMFANTIEKLLRFESEPKDDYKLLCEDDNIKAMRKEVPGQMVCLVVAQAKLFGLTPMECYKCIYDFDVRAEWDCIFSEYEVVDTLNKHQDIIYMRLKCPWGITDRDFLQKRTCTTNYKGYDFLMHFEHAEHPDKPNRKNHIRAITIISGYLFKTSPDNPNNTDVYIVAQTDVKGMVPVA